MTELKVKNTELVKKIAVGQWWRPEFEELMSADLSLEFPFAPPGMTQNPCRGQVWAHCCWMTQTVKTWDVTVERIYGPREEYGKVFFAVYHVKGEVYWGGADGVYENRHVDRITVENGRVVNIRQWFNPFKWLEAAGREIPVFNVDIPWEDVPKYREMREAKEANTDFSTAYEDIEARISANIRAFMASNSADNHMTFESPANYDRSVYWVPPIMKEHVEGDEIDQMEAWTWASIKQWQLMDDAVIYETDDRRCYFFETGGYGRAGWLGNNSEGGYQNRYIKYMELDDMGFIIKYDEYLNPICKLNSINKSIPSFPYLY